ncbi:hypothetical protein GOQ27_07950 [Clostridium sp. D2Q-11]|uniref:Uncharacterized protein n=1 Tax=Anaeromonas frigoriresistens TaxID=2683708 RepID=A0A942USH3_9FIRM|nr:hypothetical protein [Anaeromonas frigoriresistens]MBS4538394.1 hypothetical protein [Anaeromonas frigoriresistens]
MKKIIRIIGIIAAVITISNSLIFLIKDIYIPALGPFSLGIVMLSIIYSNKQRYNQGSIKKGQWRFTLIVGLIAVTLNIAAGTSQLIVAFN